MKPNSLKSAITAFLLLSVCWVTSAHERCISKSLVLTKDYVSDVVLIDTPTVRPEEMSKYIGKVVHVEIYTQNRYKVGNEYLIIAHSYYPDTTKNLLRVKLANEALADFKKKPPFMIRVTGKVKVKKGLPTITVDKMSNYKSGTTVI